MKCIHPALAALLAGMSALSACTSTVEDPAVSVEHPASPNAVDAPAAPDSTTLQYDLPIGAESTPMRHPGKHEGMESHHGDMHRPAQSNDAPSAVPPDFQTQLGATIKAYFGIAAALASDDLAGGTHAVVAVRQALASVDAAALPESRKPQWQTLRKTLDESLNTLAGAGDLNTARQVFDTTSMQLTVAAQTFGIKGAGPVYRLFCPMAFKNRGAYWLQPDDQVANPYFGRRMARCGQVSEQIQADPSEPVGHQHGEHE